MKAVVCPKYGPPEVLRVEEVEKLVPNENEMLIKIHAATVSSADYRVRGAKFPLLFWLPMRIFMGFQGPRSKRLGNELAGVVEMVGKNINKFKVGDRVFGYTGAAMGANAEYICLTEKNTITTIPENVSFEDAACIPHGGLAALHFLQKANIQAGQKVLIYGASGSIGTAAVQLAKNLGAEVTGVCSTKNIELIQSLGADHVIDYTKEDFTQNGVIYDVIFDTVGESPFAGSVKSLKDQGYYLRAVHLTLSHMLQGMWTGLTTSIKVVGAVASEKIENLEYLRDLAANGKLKSVISKRFSLDQIVEAHQYADTGHKVGNIIIQIA